MCVRTVGSRVVDGGNGIAKEPNPRPDVHVHLTRAQKGLACNTQRHDITPKYHTLVILGRTPVKSE